MKWIVGIFIIFDVIFQLFGNNLIDGWNLYYDLIHYGFIISVCLYFIHDKVMPYFLIYFTAATSVLAYQYIANQTTEIIGPIYIWAFTIIMLLLTILIQKKWTL